MRLKLLEYRAKDDTYYCRDLDSGRTFHIDLFVDASFEEYTQHIDYENDKNTNYLALDTLRKSLVGKTVEVGSIHPIVYIGSDIKIIY